MAEQVYGALPHYDIHICLVSQQLLPCLIPVLSEESKPNRVILLVSDGMRSRALILDQQLQQLGCQVTQQSIHPYRIDAIRATVLNLLVLYEGSSIALNATGGTKIMSLGAAEVFREFDLPVFYVDTDNAQYIRIFPAPASIKLPDLVRVKTYLSAYGYKICSAGVCQVPVARQQLCDHIVGNFKRYKKALSVLNGCAQAAENKENLAARLDSRFNNFIEFQQLLEQFENSGMIHVSGDILYFCSEEARRFSGGIWLEEYTVKALNALKGKGVVKDHASNIVVETATGVRNEIDVACTAGNRLHIIECKTGKLSSQIGREHRADGVAYKLDNLRELMGGTYGKTMLVSFQLLGAADRRRCKENQIELVAGPELSQLGMRLQAWIEGQ